MLNRRESPAGSYGFYCSDGATGRVGCGPRAPAFDCWLRAGDLRIYNSATTCLMTAVITAAKAAANTRWPAATAKRINSLQNMPATSDQMRAGLRALRRIPGLELRRARPGHDKTREAPPRSTVPPIGARPWHSGAGPMRSAHRLSSSSSKSAVHSSEMLVDLDPSRLRRSFVAFF
jgi:hypothetical protein